MPEGMFAIIVLLCLGYFLLLLEVVVPGGVVGVLGILSIAYGCYLAFGLGTAWGSTAAGLSVVVTLVALRLFFRSRAGKGLVLDDELKEDEGWQAAEEGLADLLGQQGRALSLLRPAGVAEIGDRRIDVVTDSEFLDVGVPVRVVAVEGRRVVVEAIETAADEED